MATGGPIRELCEELTCPICLEYFREPMIIAECGHNFCRACLIHSWGPTSSEASCPVCKQTAQPRDLRPNRQLANVVEIVKRLSLQGGEAMKEEARKGICEKHREPLKFFCQTDEILICRVCDISKEHKNHNVIATEEAAQKYKDKIFKCLETLRTSLDKILEYLADAKDENQAMLKITESERKKAVAEFRTLHQLLKVQENHVLAQIEEVEKEVAQKMDVHMTRLSEQCSSFKSLIQEMEKKHQQPVSELLQDVRGTLKSYEKKEIFENPEAFLFELKQSVQNCPYDSFLESAMKQFQDILPWVFPKLRATVTLDPASASPHLVLSLDRKGMEWHGTTQDPPEDPEKHYGFVLGSEGFTEGCHFWEVLVKEEDGWAVGVARKPVTGKVTLTPEEGIWAVGRWKGRYKAFIKGKDPPLTLREVPVQIRVCLNYTEGQVAFFDIYRAALLYEFSGASFSGETLLPFFAIYGHGFLQIYP